MTTWFTSDLHLGHARINELAGRPFSSVEEMDETIISRWNDRVKDTDEIYVLGDLAMGPFLDSMAKAATLRGRKHLVPGNHDRCSSLYSGSEAKKLQWDAVYRDAGFAILDELCYLHGSSSDALILMCHFPYEGDSHGEDRYVEARPRNLGEWLIHGHVHEQWKVRDRMINVGVDVWDFAPVSEEEILKVIESG